MKTIELTLFEFKELSEEAKQVALEQNREINVDDSWYDPIFDTFREKAKTVGFDINDIYFSGFWSQGDGAMFTYKGLYSTLLNQAVDSLDIPMWKKKILKNGYISGKGTQVGMYCHFHSCSHSIYIETDNGMNYYPNIENLFLKYHGQLEEHIIATYINLCDALYTDLYKYYTELTSDSYVQATLEEESRLFTEQGHNYRLSI